MNPEAQLKKLEQVLSILETDRASSDEVAQSFEAVLSVIKQIKDQIEQELASNKDEINLVKSDVLEKINELELKTIQMSNRLEEKMLGDNINIQKQLSQNVNSIKELIPQIPSFQPLMDRILEVERKIPQIPEISAEQVRDKLETLKDDNRLDISAIKGFGKRIAKLSDEIVNRALGILDQRTSFLINKVSNLQQKVDSINITGGAGTWYQDEVLTRTDGTNYTLAHTPTAVVFLYLNGQLLPATGNYTRTGTAISLTSPTIASDTLSATYN